MLSRHGRAPCNSSDGEVEAGRWAGHLTRLALLESSGTMRDLFSMTKVDNTQKEALEITFWPPCTCEHICMHSHMCMCTHREQMHKGVCDGLCSRQFVLEFFLIAVANDLSKNNSRKKLMV